MPLGSEIVVRTLINTYQDAELTDLGPAELRQSEAQ